MVQEEEMVTVKSKREWGQRMMHKEEMVTAKSKRERKIINKIWPHYIWSWYILCSVIVGVKISFLFAITITREILGLQFFHDDSSKIIIVFFIIMDKSLFMLRQYFL